MLNNLHTWKCISLPSTSSLVKHCSEMLADDLPSLLSEAMKFGLSVWSPNETKRGVSKGIDKLLHGLELPVASSVIGSLTHYCFNPCHALPHLQ